MVPVRNEKDFDQDRLLMARAAKGDRRAFEVLYERFKGPIMSYLLTLVKESRLAEELTQETFLKVYRARESYEPKAKFTTWLWTIAKNTAFDHLDKKGELLLKEYENDDGTSSSLLDTLESPLPDSESALLEEADRRAVEACLNELPEKQRRIVALRIFSDLSYEEIAEQSRMTLGSVKTQLHRAKEKLTECFRKGGHAS